MLKTVFGVVAFTIGWTGASVLFGLLIYTICEMFGVKISYEISSTISVIAGALLGAIPFGILGAEWASKKWPRE